LRRKAADCEARALAAEEAVAEVTVA
jgi:hypothetical protein